MIQTRSRWSSTLSFPYYTHLHFLKMSKELVAPFLVPRRC